MATRSTDGWLWLAAGGGLLGLAYLLAGGRTMSRSVRSPIPGKRTTTAGELARLSALEPDVRARLEQLAARMAAHGVRLYWGSGVRTEAEQKRMLAKGTTTTIASWHRAGRAMDVYPIDPDTGLPDKAAKREDLIRLIHREWFALGGLGLAYRPYPDGPKRWITGPKGKLWDAGHLEHHGSFTSAVAAIEARAAKVA